jgi:hypothetical protein
LTDAVGTLWVVSAQIVASDRPSGQIRVRIRVFGGKRPDADFRRTVPQFFLINMQPGRLAKVPDPGLLSKVVSN